jgi:hypothetical protein
MSLQLSQRKQLSVSLALVLASLISSAVASAAPVRPGTGTGGKTRCIDRCTDRYLDCQLDNAPGSLDHSLCDQKFDRCAQICDLIYTRAAAGSALKHADQAIIEEVTE